MTPEQIEALNRITSRLKKTISAGHPNRPVLCYALDSDYLSDSEYGAFKDKIPELIVQQKPKEITQYSYFSAVLLVFVRNFFERGDGRNYWSCSSIEKQKDRDDFQYLIQNDSILHSLNVRMDLLPESGQEFRDWGRSQCWVIRANDRGPSSALITNNEKLLNSYIAQFGKLESWNEPPAQINEWRISSDLEAIPYVSELYTHHRWELLQSLFAVTAEGEMPADLPRWLHPLWGLKRGEMKVENRESSAEKTKAVGKGNVPQLKAEWMLRFYGDEIEPVLRLQMGTDRTILQGELTYTPSRDDVLVSDMIRRGFRLEAGLEIKCGESFLELAPLLQSVDETCTVFRAPGTDERKVRYCGVMDGYSYKWRSRVCLLHRKDFLELMCADTICDCLQTRTIYDRDARAYFYISCYKLPDVKDERFVLLPGIGSEIEMANRVQVHIEHDFGNKAYKDGYECIVVCSSEKMAQLSFSGAEMTYIESQGTRCVRLVERDCCIEGNDFYSPYKLSFETRAGQRLEKTVLFVPDDFFDEAVYLDLSKPGKWQFEKAGCLFEGSLIQSEWVWNDDTVQRCINVGDYAEPVLKICRPYTSIELRIGNRSISKDAALCDRKRLSEILSMFEDLQPKTNCELWINEKIAYRGPFNPAGSCIYKSGNDVRFYNERKTGVIYIRHELYYKHYLDETTRNEYQKIFDANEAFRRTHQNSVVINPGLYRNAWEPGHVIFEQGAERCVCFELPYTGDKSIKDRWGEIDPKMCSLVTLMMSYDNDAIKNTRLYSEIEALPAIIVKHLPFTELSAITRAGIMSGLWERALHEREDMTALGYTRPAYCKLSNCPNFDSYGYASTCNCRDKLPCIQRIHRVSNPYYSEEEKRKGIASIHDACKTWVENVSIDDRDAQSLCANVLRKMDKAGVLRKTEEPYLYEIIQKAIEAKKWVVAFYLLAGTLIGKSEKLKAELRQTAERLAKRIPADRIDVLTKFVMLVRWISNRFTK